MIVRGGNLMLRRTTEIRNHNFQQRLFKEINAFDLQGLTMNFARSSFTAGVEYFDLELNEYLELQKNPSNVFNLPEMLAIEHIHAQLLLTRKLDIPLYYIFGYEDEFFVDELSLNNNKISHKSKVLNTLDFVKFWRTIKGTLQTQSTDRNGAKDRSDKTRIDKILEKQGLAWGGNIDGFIIQNGEIISIIDCISIGPGSQKITGDLTDPKADPGLYFKIGPTFKTWEATITLARAIGVPHLLFTLDIVNLNSETIGLTGIDFLSRRGIRYFKGIKPNNNVIYDLDKISVAIFDLINNLSIPKIFN